MSFGPLPEPVVVARADGFAEALEPRPGPGELDTEYREADRDHHEGGARSHDHDDAEQ